MSQDSKTEQVLRALKDYHLDLLAVSEVRWLGSGSNKLDGDVTIIYSGSQQKREYGVALMMTKQTSQALLQWTPVSPRILKARFIGAHVKLSVIVCYAPTNDATDEAKDEFYRALNSVANDIPRHDMACFLGDFNAKVGNDRSFSPEVLGEHGLGQRNENGELLIDFALLNDLVIGGTLFSHRDVHKYSWISPDGHTRNQIDHCLWSRKWRSSLLDIRGYRGADVGSDHNLMAAKIRLKLKRNRKANKAPLNPVFDSEKLRLREFNQAFKLEMRNRFEALSLLDDADSNQYWESIKLCFHNAAKATIGYRKSPKDQWLSDQTWELIETRKKVKASLIQRQTPDQQILRNDEYRAADKEVKKSARKDQRNLLERKAAQAEEAAERGDSRAVYKITNEIIGKKSSIQHGPVTDPSGILITQQSDVNEVWASHFEKLLNRPPPEDPPEIPATTLFSLDISTDPPSSTEIIAAAKKLKNGKSPGEDRISAEMIKATVMTCIKFWTALFAVIWTTAKIPSDWKRSTLVRIFKKGDTSFPGNWRGICMLSIPSKLLTHILLQRISSQLDRHLRDEQHGFRPNRSCADLIFTLRLLTEESREWRSKIYMIFIDFEKAFDSVDRQSLWKILLHYGIPEKIVSLIVAFYEDSECCVKTPDGQTRFFRIMSGVKQGCVLSPLLFVIVIDYILRSTSTDGIQLNPETRLSDVDFADDIAVLESCKQRLQELLDKVRERGGHVGLKINNEKTKCMATTDSPLSITCGDQHIEQVVHFKYLGSIIESTGSTTKEVLTRIGQANGAFNRLRKVWRSQSFSIRLKLRLFNSNVMPVLLYAAETWHLNQEQERRILAFENTCLRRILNIRWQQRITNQSIRDKTGQPLVTYIIRVRRWRYLGHVLRMDNLRLPNAALHWQPSGPRRRGRPRNTLRRTYQTDLRNLHTSIQPQWEDILAAANRREDWRLLLDALGASGGTGGSKV